MSPHFSYYKGNLMVDGAVLRPRKWYEKEAWQIVGSLIFLAVCAFLFVCALIAFA